MSWHTGRRVCGMCASPEYDTISDGGVDLRAPYYGIHQCVKQADAQPVGHGDCSVNNGGCDALTTCVTAPANAATNSSRICGSCPNGSITVRDRVDTTIKRCYTACNDNCVSDCYHPTTTYVLADFLGFVTTVIAREPHHAP